MEAESSCCATSKGSKTSCAISLGLLIIRIGIGIAFIIHGYPKLMGGPEKWAGLGGVMGMYGITFMPAFWGFMAAFAEAIGGLCLLLGIFVRPMAFIMFFTMLTATLMHMNKGGSFSSYSHALELGVVFLGLVFTGGGNFALGACLPFLKNKCYR